MSRQEGHRPVKPEVVILVVSGTMTQVARAVVGDKKDVRFALSRAAVINEIREYHRPAFRGRVPTTAVTACDPQRVRAHTIMVTAEAAEAMFDPCQVCYPPVSETQEEEE